MGTGNCGSRSSRCSIPVMMGLEKSLVKSVNIRSLFSSRVSSKFHFHLCCSIMSFFEFPSLYYIEHHGFRTSWLLACSNSSPCRNNCFFPFFSFEIDTDNKTAFPSRFLVSEVEYHHMHMYQGWIRARYLYSMNKPQTSSRVLHERKILCCVL